MSAIAFLLQTIRIAIPYLLAAAGGVMSERVGIIALGLEGLMLSGAFGAAMGSYYGGSPWIGLLGALAAGLVMTGVLAIATLRFKANQVVVGVALNLLVVAVTRFFLRLVFDSASNSPRVPGFGGEGTANAMLASFANPVVWIGLVALPALGWLLYQTPFGLRARAVGEKPEAAVTLGINVGALRLKGLLLGGALASLGGAYLRSTSISSRMA